MRDNSLVFILIITVLLAGCLGDNQPEILSSPSNKITVTAGNPSELEIWVKNNYDEPASFKISISTPTYINITDPETGKEKYTYDLGDAGSDSQTVKQVMHVVSSQSALDKRETSTLKNTITITATRTDVQNINGGIPPKNITVEVQE